MALYIMSNGKHHEGNRITTVLEDADAVTQNGSMDYPGGNREMEFGYNEWGALVKDESRGITNIAYDRFGNPIRISYKDGSYSENVYSATGEKLKTTHTTSIPGSSVSARSMVEYRGNVIYRDGKVDMVLFPGGYASVNGTAVTFHYYTQDYLGNNRAVVNGSTGAIEQLTAYYPFGAVIADLGTPATGQPYRFGSKELMTANGLNEYDFGARQYYPAVPAFTRIDPLCEKYYWLSPYLYCANNPVNAVDPSGMIVIGLDDQARQNILYTLTEEEAKFVSFNDDGMIDVELLNQFSSDSENFSELRSVVNSETTYYVCTASQYTSAGRTRELKEPGKGGTAGVTLMPNAVEEPSPDNNVYIYTSNRIPISEQVENLSHELYGHGYFYELKSLGFDVNPYHEYGAVVTQGDFLPEYNAYDYITVRVDFNTALDNQIKKVTLLGKRNYNSRQR